MSDCKYKQCTSCNGSGLSKKTTATKQPNRKRNVKVKGGNVVRDRMQLEFNVLKTLYEEALGDFNTMVNQFRASSLDIEEQERIIEGLNKDLTAATTRNQTAKIQHTLNNANNKLATLKDELNKIVKAREDYDKKAKKYFGHLRRLDLELTQHKSLDAIRTVAHHVEPSENKKKHRDADDALNLLLSGAPLSARERRELLDTIKGSKFYDNNGREIEFNADSNKMELVRKRNVGVFKGQKGKHKIPKRPY
jgi:hypothetical protein